MFVSIESRRESTIRRARARAGLGLRQLARQMGVTAKAITDWEISEELGTVQLNTLQRALDALGEDVVVATRRRSPHDSEARLERREDRVSLELHRAVAIKLMNDPDAVLRGVPRNLERLRSRVQGASAASWLDEWAELGQTGDLGGFVNVMLGTDQRSVNMRQTSPFLGVLTQLERLAAIERARSA